MTELIRFIIAGIAIGSVYALVGLSFSYLYKGTNLINWAQADWFTLGTFCAYLGTVALRLPYWVTLIGTVVFLFILGYGFYRTLVRWMVNRGAGMIGVLLATIALSILVQNSIGLIWGFQVFHVPSPLPGSTRIGAIVVPNQYFFVIAIAVVLVVSLYLVMNRTNLGRSMRASADNPFAASVVGIPSARVDATTWGIGAAIAGVAGAIVAPIFGAYAFLALTVGIKGFAAAVVGGFGRPYGALAGGLLIGVVETLGAAYWSSAWKDGIAMILLILILVARPHGLFKAVARA